MIYVLYNENPNVKLVSLEELLKNSDFITIHCPLTETTKHLIDALQNKVIAGPALDVQDPEPPKSDNPLFTMDNVILTPHIGWQCLESRQRLIDLLANTMDLFIKDSPINVVNP